MDPQVLGQMGLLTEPFAALRAPVRPRVGVYPFVLQQRALLLEIFAARETLEQSQIAALLHAAGRRRRLVHVVAGQQVGYRVLLERGRGRLVHREAGQRLVEIVQRREAGRCQHRALSRVTVVVQLGLRRFEAAGRARPLRRRRLLVRLLLVVLLLVRHFDALLGRLLLARLLLPILGHVLILVLLMQ